MMRCIECDEVILLGPIRTRFGPVHPSCHWRFMVQQEISEINERLNSLEESRRHRYAILVILFRTEATQHTQSSGVPSTSSLEGHMAKSIPADSTKGLVLTLAEIRASDGKVYPLTAGPFQVDVQDPAGTVDIVPGSADQTTPTIFHPNGTKTAGTVTVKVTDTSNGLSGTASFDVTAVAPPPPPPADVPDTLNVDFVPEA